MFFKARRPLGGSFYDDYGFSAILDKARQDYVEETAERLKASERDASGGVASPSAKKKASKPINLGVVAVGIVAAILISKVVKKEG